MKRFYPILLILIAFFTNTKLATNTYAKAHTINNIKSYDLNINGKTEGATLLIAPSNLSYDNDVIVAVINETNVLATPTVTGTVNNYSITPALPSGVSLNNTTGVISGIPTILSPLTNYTITASNADGSTSTTISIVVNNIAAPSNLTYYIVDIVTIINETNVLATPTVTGTVSNYSIAPSLPSGLSINASTGVISGIPTVLSPATSYTITAANASGSTTTTISITVNNIPAPSNLSYSVSAIESIVNQTNINSTPTVTGVVSNYSISPVLPSGVSINATTGIISGIPTVLSPITNYTITATNAGGFTTTTISIVVNNIGAPSNLSYNIVNIVAVVNETNVHTTPTVTGTVSNYSIAPTLPSGLSINASTGVISGIPTVLSAATNYTITASNAGGSTTTSITITVNNIDPPSNLSYSPDNIIAIINETNVLANPTVTGTVNTYSINPALPSGISINSTTGVISGIPTVLSSATNYTITATNSGGSTTTSISITINNIDSPSNLSYSPNNIIAIINETNVLANPTVTGTVDTYSINPALPSGISINSTTGVISGIPTVLSSATNYTITATNSGGSTTTSISITVNNIDPPSNLSYSPNSIVAVINETNVLANPTVTGTVDNYSIFPALPSGISINSTTGVISGIPTILSSSTAYTITATNSGGSTTTSISITVNNIAPPSNLSYSPDNIVAVINETNVLANPTVTGTVDNYSITPSLPNGINFNTATGIISGIPTALSPTTNYTIAASNAGGSTTTSVSITVNNINAPSDLTYDNDSIVAIVNETNILATPTVTGDVDGYNISPTLPDGINLNTTTGVISGISTATIPLTNFTVTATNSGGSATASLSITVNNVAPTGLVYNTDSIVATVNESNILATPSITGIVDNYSIVPNLPNGLDINTATGVISGISTETIPLTNYTVTATNSGGSATASLSITVNNVPPTGLVYDTDSIVATVNESNILATPSITGIVDNYSIVPDLPTGIDINTATGVISGIPTATIPLTNYNITATNSGGSTTTSLSITVNIAAPSDLSYDNDSIVAIVNETNILASPNVTGTADNYSISPSLPEGVSINATSGVISGIPTTTLPLSNFTITASNAQGSTNASLSITVNIAAPSDLSYDNDSIVAIVNETNILASPNITGTVDNYSISPSLPNGVSIDATSGVISGIPTTTLPLSNFTITASNAQGFTTTFISITVNSAAPSDLSYDNDSIVAIVNETNILASPSITGTVDNYNISPSLPNGVSIDATSGVISGIPTATLPLSNFTITASNGQGFTTTIISITVNSAAPSDLSYDNDSIVAIVNETNILASPNVTGTVDNYSISPSLPDGVSIDSTNGVISGIPTTTLPLSNFTITASNAQGSTTTLISITVNNTAFITLSYDTDSIVAIVNETNILASPNVTGTVNNYSISPTLPEGVSIDATSGVISGIPSIVTPLTNYTISASSSAGISTTVISITVNNAAPSDLFYDVDKIEAIVNETMILSNPNVTGTVSSFSIDSVLPMGVSFDSITGIISGVPAETSPLTEYTITARNSEGSASTFFILSVVDNSEDVKLTNYMSPNGDGINDYWTVDLNIVSGYQLYIYNNLGAIVYETTNYDNTWNATFNGNDLPSDTYYYIFRKEQHLIKGTISVVR